MGDDKQDKRMTITRLNEMVNERFNKIEVSLNELSNNFKRIDDGFSKADTTVNNINNDLSEMRKSIIDTLVMENRKLQDKIKKLEKRLNDVEWDVDENFNKIEEIEEKVESTNQYGRRNNIEISGIPNVIDDDNLEGKIIEVFDKININISKTDIEACHRLPPPKNNSNGNKKVIIRFANRKICKKAFNNKKELKNIEMSSLNFADGSKLFINENLNPYFSRVGWQCRKLKNGKRINSYFFKNESFVINFGSSGCDINKKITRKSQLFDLFPDFFEAVF